MVTGDSGGGTLIEQKVRNSTFLFLAENVASILAAILVGGLATLLEFLTLLEQFRIEVRSCFCEKGSSKTKL